ncbi:flagellar export protein FliJ [Desulfocurvus sp.]|jgi:flagellar FliJ protein|uniref:flagellar export protein FliJ n=1 Tax=Desulfocurvus sp. TaxID=2871698 RepID=UPI0025B9C45A|nr:flagellar export protein FliJ [Desulfocurvus sp.]MCK9239683.1 flagellar export protein FliJ [Desulfocurvus sp.]
MAKGFRFSLERVLDYRRQQEDQARMLVARALAAHRAQQAEADGLRHALDRHMASLYGGAQVTENDLWLWRRYRVRLEEDLALAERTLMQRGRELTQARQELVARARDRKLLERLRAGKERDFHARENQKEQRESDEMATLRYGHEAV